MQMVPPMAEHTAMGSIAIFGGSSVRDGDDGEAEAHVAATGRASVMDFDVRLFYSKDDCERVSNAGPRAHTLHRGALVAISSQSTTFACAGRWSGWRPQMPGRRRCARQ